MASRDRFADGRNRSALVLLAFLALLVASTESLRADNPAAELSPELQRVRAALDKYQDPVVAVHDGYFSTLGCVEYLQGGGPGDVPTYVPGGMGVHFFNTALIGPTLDPMRPQVLVYEPVGDKLRLVAAEWFVPLSTGIPSRPTLFGKPFDGPMAGHHPLMPVAMSHYDLHVWLWKENPAGLFSPTNPSLKCPAATYTFAEKVPQVVPHEAPKH
jgi:hypothetical protein